MTEFNKELPDLVNIWVHLTRYQIGTQNEKAGFSDRSTAPRKGESRNLPIGKFRTLFCFYAVCFTTIVSKYLAIFPNFTGKLNNLLVGSRGCNPRKNT